jgi:exonuclease SbcC
MIPIKLRISGFLSYREPVELDFSTFDLACISGHNGAGKSSLLDAITWSLFGKARKTDESVINLAVAKEKGGKAEVVFIFDYEQNTYRVQRSLPSGKSTMLEFQIRDGEAWRTLSERTLRETQARIEQVLRLDYDTFVNAAFFLQGKADQFTQQTASKRKEVLGSILGLEAWETYRTRTAEKRKKIEGQVENMDGRVMEIDTELAEEPLRKSRLAELEGKLEGRNTALAAQQKVVDALKKEDAMLEAQRNSLDMLAGTLERSKTGLSGLQNRLAAKQADRNVYADLVARAVDVDANYQAWQRAREELARMDEIAGQFREGEKLRQPLLEVIAAEKARLEQEAEALRVQGSRVSQEASQIAELQVEIDTARKSLEQAEADLARRDEIEKRITSARERLAALKAENQTLKVQMDELKARIDQLSETDDVVCPLCGQDLSEEHRRSTLDGLEKDGRSQGDRYRANQDEMKSLAEGITGDEASFSEVAGAEATRMAASTKITRLGERLEGLEKLSDEWKKTGEGRLAEILESLEKESFAEETREKLAVVDEELGELGYDAAAHDNARGAELQGRSAEEEFRNLEAARSALKPIQDEISALLSDIEKKEAEVATQQMDYDQAAAALAASEASVPNVDAAYSELLQLQEEVNRLTQEVGAARQLVNVLDDLRERKANLASEREGKQRLIGQYKTLERAFGKNGVPALLIEAALPQIETRANELLDRLSNGQMSIRFVTQAEYKDKNRDDLRETLDIQISDGAGMRDYEMYSGGEAFRVNFAVRLALSEILAQRKGARLQTLVIDEGFGSQDLQGRQRLIEAINLVKSDFAKILVITHLDELKDAFPTRIEVEKTAQGSTLQVI